MYLEVFLMGKYYAVKNGRQTGIYNSWSECEAQVKGFKGALYKSFSSYDDACNYLEEKKNVQTMFPFSIPICDSLKIGTPFLIFSLLARIS